MAVYIKAMCKQYVAAPRGEPTTVDFFGGINDASKLFLT